MKKLILILSLSSCTTAFHHRQILKKDPNFYQTVNDTIRVPVTTYDTIFMDGDTIAIVERVTFRDTIIEVRTINPKSRHDVRIEKRKLKHVEKIAKTDVKLAQETTKQAKAENRTYKGLLSSLVLGIIIGIMIGTRIPRFWLVKK
jgi:hypothetical protein